MAECWSCGAERGEAAACGSCGKLQPPAKRVDYFRLLGLPRTFRQDRSALDKAFRERSKAVHPDRFAMASAVERRLAVEHTGLVNDAYRSLRDLERRAEYLMSLEGVTVGAETERTTDQRFLMEMLELQEAIESLGSSDGAESLRSQLTRRRESLTQALERYFDGREGTQATAVEALNELRYLRRLLESLDRRMEEVG